MDEILANKITIKELFEEIDLNVDDEMDNEYYIGILNDAIADLNAQTGFKLPYASTLGAGNNNTKLMWYFDQPNPGASDRLIRQFYKEFIIANFYKTDTEYNTRDTDIAIYLERIKRLNEKSFDELFPEYIYDRTFLPDKDTWGGFAFMGSNMYRDYLSGKGDGTF